MSSNEKDTLAADSTDFSLARVSLWISVVLVTAGTLGGLGIVEPLIVAALTVALLLALVVIRSPDLAIFWVVFVLYSNIAVVAVHFHGVPKAVAAAFPLLLGVPLVRNLVFRRQGLLLDPTALFILAFIVIQTVGLAFSKNPAAGKPVILQHLLEGLLIYLLVLNVVRTEKTLRLATWGLLLAGLVIGAFPVLQQLTGSFHNQFGGMAQTGEFGFRTGEWTAQGEGRQIRMSGPIGEENRYAQIMLMLVPLAFLRFMGERKRSLRTLALFCLGFAGLGVLLAFSRGAVLSLALIFILAVCMRVVRGRALAVALLLGLAVLVSLPQVWTRLSSVADLGMFASGNRTSEVDSSIRGRATEMIAAAQIFVDHPVVGAGPGMYREYSREYGNRLGIRKLHESRRAHSLYLEIAAENGALGLSVLLGMFYVTLSGLVVVRRRWHGKRPDLANMATAYLLAVSCYLVSGIFLHMSYVRFIYLILALAGATIAIARREAARSPALESRNDGGEP